MEKNFAPHDIVWDYEKISRIWEYYARNAAYEDSYFSKQVGDAIIRTFLAHHDLKGNILDYGCGHGHLLGKLLKKGASAQGLEFSADSVKLVEKKFNNEKLFKGVTLAERLPSPLDNEQFDVIFFITAIEHLLTEDIHPTLKEIHRITRNGGYVFIVTNNEENLDKQKLMCPECGCIFHMVQHVSSWTKASLSAVMNESGFNEVLCKPTRLMESGLAGFLRYILYKMEAVVFRKKQPHLIYIGRKNG